MDSAKLHRYLRTTEFAERFEAAITVGTQDTHGASAEEIAQETAEARDVIDELRASGRHKALCADLDKLSQSVEGCIQVCNTTFATATALLLAKTAMPGEEMKFLAEVHERFEPVRALPSLVELAGCLIDGELAGRDSIRDRAIIDDALFDRRIIAIRQALGRTEARQL